MTPVLDTQLYPGFDQVQRTGRFSNPVEKYGYQTPIYGPSNSRNQPLFKLETQLTKQYWDGEIKSYLLQDSRIQLENLVKIYVKGFNQDNGSLYYVEFSEWCRINELEVTYGVSPGMLQIIDPKQKLKRKTIAILFVSLVN